MLHASIEIAKRVLNGVSRPEYTGENRCVPCTVINLGITAIGVWVLWQLSPTTGALFGGVAVTAIFLRGYLVPGTATLTKRYLPDSLLRRFDHGPPGRGGIDETVPVDPLELFGAANVLVETDRDVVLESTFERRLATRVDAIEQENLVGALAELLAVPSERLSLDSNGSVPTVHLDGRWVGQWESRAALLTDIAANRELAEIVPEWADFSLDQRSGLLAAVRACLRHCPMCGDDVELFPDVVESCCRTVDVIAASCNGCGARLFELEQDGNIASRGSLGLDRDRRI